MERKFDNFVMNADWWEDIMDLPEEMQWEAMQAFMQWTLYDVEPADKYLKALLRPYVRAVKAGRKKYADKCERNKKNISARWRNSVIANNSNSCDSVVSSRIKSYKVESSGIESYQVESSGIKSYRDTDTDTDTDTELLFSSKEKNGTTSSKKDIVAASGSGDVEDSFFKHFLSDEAEPSRQTWATELGAEEEAVKKWAEEIRETWRLHGERHPTKARCSRHLFNTMRKKADERRTARTEAVPDTKAARPRAPVRRYNCRVIREPFEERAGTWTVMSDIERPYACPEGTPDPPGPDYYWDPIRRKWNDERPLQGDSRTSASKCPQAARAGG